MPCGPFKSSLHIVLPLFIKKARNVSNTFQAVAAHNAIIGAKIEFGAPDWVRTSDLRLRKPTLFQLSYGYKCERRKHTAKMAFRKLKKAACTAKANSARHKYLIQTKLINLESLRKFSIITQIIVRIF